VTGEEPAKGNKYNQNFRNRFCSCSMEYDPSEEKGTMFQCLGLGSVEEGGCGEDWYHPDCLMALPRDWRKKVPAQNNSSLETVKEEGTEDAPEQDESGPPPGFPNEDDFENLICYKCVTAFPWIKPYAGTNGFLMPLYHGTPNTEEGASDSRKRKASPEPEEFSLQPTKRVRSEDATSPSAKPSLEVKEVEAQPSTRCLYQALPPAPTGTFTILTIEEFRPHLCHCPAHFPLLKPHPQLLAEEDIYEPPISEGSSEGSYDGVASVGSRSLLERGEAALSNVDRVRAIEGVMVYNHLKEQVKSFLKPFADSGTPVGAEDIKKYFETLRGDAEAIKAAGQGVGGGDTDNRKEQSGKFC
jgi:E3 ubiquitin-protein ligase UBR7